MAATAKQLVKEKKNWYMIVASNLFPDAVLGESIVSDVDELMNRHITVNLMTLTNDAKHQSINVTFKINKIADNRAFAEVIAYETSPSALKRFVRRDISRLDDSFVCESLDKKQFRIKMMVLTKSKTTSSVLKAIRRSMVQAIARETAKNDFETIIRMVIGYKLQGGSRDSLKKIYPLRGFEIKKIELVKKAGARIVKPKADLEQKEAQKENADVAEEQEEEQ